MHKYPKLAENSRKWVILTLFWSVLEQQKELEAYTWYVGHISNLLPAPGKIRTLRAFCRRTRRIHIRKCDRNIPHIRNVTGIVRVNIPKSEYSCEK